MPGRGKRFQRCKWNGYVKLALSLTTNKTITKTTINMKRHIWRNESKGDGYYGVAVVIAISSEEAHGTLVKHNSLAAQEYSPWNWEMITDESTAEISVQLDYPIFIAENHWRHGLL